jgi:hypothetical protein
MLAVLPNLNAHGTSAGFGDILFQHMLCKMLSPSQQHQCVDAAVERFCVCRDGRRRLMVPNNSFISREFLVYDDVLTPDAARMGGSSSAAGSRSSSPWPGANSSSSSAAQQEELPWQAGPSYSAPYGAGSRHVEPSIREGHMSTELPPLAPPIFPGMTLVPPGYAQYGPAHYAPYATYQQLQELQQQQQQQLQQQSEEDEDESTDADGEQGRQQGDVSRDKAPAADAQWPGQPQGAAAQASADWQQGSSSSSSKGSSSSGRRSKSKAARGPPGYLPQGYTAPPPYLGIPVYWPLLNPWGTAPGRQQQQQQQVQQPQQPQQRQQQQTEQQLHEFDGPGMHQPVMPHYSPLPQQQMGSQDPWQQQQWPQPQWQHAPPSQGAGDADSGTGGSATSGGSSNSSQRSPGSQAHGNSHNHSISGSSRNTAANPAQTQHAAAPGSSSSSQRAEAVHHQAVHMAALGGSSYGFWGSPVPPVPLQPSDFQQQQQYWQAMQYPHSIPQPLHPSHMQMQMHPGAAGYAYMDAAAAASSQPGSSSSSSEASMSPSPTDFLAAPYSPEPAVAAAAGVGSGLAASLSSLQPLSNGMGAASAAAAAAGAAMRHMPGQELGGLAEQAAGGLLGPPIDTIAGMCKEVGQSLADLP